MGSIRQPDRVKLITGILAARAELIAPAQELLVKHWGAIDEKSEVLDFTYTSYYEKELGANPVRCWFSFEKLIDPSALAEIKKDANRFEESLAQNGLRVVNIDPGYIALSKLVLASTKDYSHRIYLSGGIYAEVTLQYKHNTWHALPWSYPDYQSPPAQAFFSSARDRLHHAVINIPVV